LVQAGNGATIVIWDPVTGQKVYTLKGHEDALFAQQFTTAKVSSTAYSPDGNWLATGGTDGTVRLWDVKKDYQPAAVLSAPRIRSNYDSAELARLSKLLGQAGPALDSERYILSLTFSPDSGQLIAVVGQHLHVYDLEPILAERNKPVKQLLSESETLMGLQRQGDRLVARERNRLVREGESLRTGIQPDKSEVIDRLSRGMTARNQRQYAEARRQFETVLKERGLPKELEELARIGVSWVYFSLGDLKNAEAEVRTVLAMNPNHANAQLLLGLLLIQESRWSEAVKHYRTILAEPGLLPEWEKQARFHLALAYGGTWDLDKAEAELGTLLAVDPKNVQAKLLLGFVYGQQRRFAKAETHLRDLVSGPDLDAVTRRSVRLTLASVYAETGRMEQAEAAIGKLSDAEKNTPDALAFRADLFAVKDEYLDQAEAMIQNALKVHPKNPQYEATLGWILAKRGRPKDGLGILEKLATNEVLIRDPVFFDHLGDVYQKANQPDKARKAWKQALTLFPTTTASNDLRRLEIQRKLKTLGAAP
jgi:Tfp pilus assembly protein PilF